MICAGFTVGFVNMGKHHCFGKNSIWLYVSQYSTGTALLKFVPHLLTVLSIYHVTSRCVPFLFLLCRYGHSILLTM